MTTGLAGRARAASRCARVGVAGLDWPGSIVARKGIARKPPNANYHMVPLQTLPRRSEVASNTRIAWSESRLPPLGGRALARVSSSWPVRRPKRAHLATALEPARVGECRSLDRLWALAHSAVHSLCVNPAFAVVWSAKADEDVGAPASQAAPQPLARALAVGGSVQVRPARRGAIESG